MIVHHIRLDDIRNLERMFAKKTTQGWVHPTWVRELRSTYTYVHPVNRVLHAIYRWL